MRKVLLILGGISLVGTGLLVYFITRKNEAAPESIKAKPRLIEAPAGSSVKIEKCQAQNLTLMQQKRNSN